MNVREMENTKGTPTVTLPEEEHLKLVAEVARLQQLVVDLKHNVEVYRRLAFGPSSEKRKPVEDDGAPSHHPLRAT